MNQHDGAEWREASRREACPVCGKPDWCSLTGPRGDADAAYCMREPSDRPKGDGWVHRLKDRGLDRWPGGSHPSGSRGASPIHASSSQTASNQKGPNRQPGDSGDGGKVYATLEEAVASYSGRHGPPDRRWVYQDADGDDVLVVLRWNARGDRKKEIRPVRRVAGGWSRSQPPKGRPLYRLTDVLTSDGVVYVTEGEPAADALIALGLTATTSSGGSSAPDKTDWSPLAGREVVLLPDNDDSGRKYRDKTLALWGRLASRPMARVVELPGLPPKGDAVDWFAAGRTLEELLRIVGSTEPAELPAAAPLLTYRSFPTALLPDAMARFVREASRAVGCDEAMVALPALAAAAGAIGATRTVRLKRTWYEPAVLWCVLVSPSGAMKSQGRKLVLAPVLKRQKQELAAYQDAMRAFGPLQSLYERDLSAWKKSKSDELPPEPPESPTLRELLVSDTTIEAVAKALYANPRGVMLDRDELAAWFESFGVYKSGKGGGGDAQSWMNLHGAGYLKVNRSSAAGPPLFVDRACVSVFGTIQPTIFTRTLSSDHRESGLAARLLIANPPRKPKRWTDEEVSEATETAFTSAMLGLLDLEFGVGPEEEPVPVALGLSAAAQRRFVAFVNRHGEEGIRRDGDEAAAWSKLEGYAARLALVMALFDDAEAVEVSDDLLQRAIGLVEWFGHEAARFYRGARESDEDRRLRELAEWITSRHDGALTPRQLVQGRRDVKTAEEAEVTLAALVGAGYGEWRLTPTATKTRREFVLASCEDAVPSTSTDSPETRAPRENVDVDAREPAETTTDDDGWEAA